MRQVLLLSLPITTTPVNCRFPLLELVKSLRIDEIAVGDVFVSEELITVPQAD